MLDIAPNVSALVGSATAAKLIADAGGLVELANLPACNVKLVGAQKKILAGFSSDQLRIGYIEQTDLFHSTPPSLRGHVSRALVAKLSLAARVDVVKGDSTGQIGRKFLQEVRKKIDKLQEPPTAAKIHKALPVPYDSRSKKKRGGKRLRNAKERYRVTEMRQLANRVQFNVPEESSLGDGLGVGYGMFGQDECGKLRVSATPTRLKLSKTYKSKLAY
ncbi:U4/U6 small nuclear ribonucleoprotein Prp31 homolog [Chenopodium quinoa]|uniref:U4/U6 small nuclear ribonucleoprotein Prp31 homolog n=1 Tax=Chenopodium quinoa TaxID=63459 RepID=UPI000B78D7C3|nr:U4/U6 small nuclear ribonucleoprotein Prp31 homolog [Chenopodium quinoa]